MRLMFGFLVCISVNVMSFLMNVRRPPPSLCGLSFLSAVYVGMYGNLLFGFSLDSCIVMMSMLWSFASSCSSAILFVMPFTFICRIFKSEGAGFVMDFDLDAGLVLVA